MAGGADRKRRRSRTRAAAVGGAFVAILAIAAIWAPRAASGRIPAHLAAFDTAFADWMRRHRIPRGVLAVALHGRLVLLRGHGGVDPRRPVPLASLSKAITGACVATLIRDGKLALETRLDAALKGFFRRHGPPADPRAGTITVAQLLTHRSGFSRSANPDPASGPALVAQLRAHGGAAARLDEAAAKALRYRLARPPGEAYEYVNANYLLLGAVIEAASGRRYEAFCRAAVLTPMGVAQAALGPKWGALSSYGGWSLAAADYLAFYAAFARDPGLFDPATRRWMLSPAGKAMGAAPDAHYSLGIVVRNDRGGPSYWHTGLWTHAQRDAAGGPLADSFATLAVRSAGGAAWFAYVAPQPSKAARAALDTALWRAARNAEAGARSGGPGLQP